MIDIVDKNKSYTNKDFQSIYDEMLELVPKLTTKWNPSESNEADPGVVLIKLMAALGDKLNYNIDKQVLEMFPGTVTQRKNARQLYDLIGYKMKWYRSAVVNVSFKLRTGIPTSDLPTENIIIPRFTQLTDANNQVSFVILNEVEIDITNQDALYTVQAMEGVINDLTINNEKNIKISDLDENNRVYFDATRIAENGIFIADSNSPNVFDWEQVDNIEAQPLGRKVFEFKVSADETVAYIQFPYDMNSLVEQMDSVIIKYITTNGSNGNIDRNILEKFSESITDSNNIPLESQVRIIQELPAQFGADPETIDDAYKNSRLIIGTFNTLITRLDYQNYIRRLIVDNKPLVSNVVVADRTNDINYTNKVVVLEDFRERTVTGASISENDYLTAYDIVLYMLEPSSTYDGAFLPIETLETKYQIEELVSDVKAVNQDLHLPTGDGSTMYLFRNKFKLKGQIITSEKLTKDEALALENKIKEALQQKYSAYNVEFGKIIDYSDLVNFITSIDSRIKTVALDSPTYQISLTERVGDSLNKEVTLSDDKKQELVARMITAGNVQLFNFESGFNKDFGQTLVENITDRIKSISTETVVELDSTDVNATTLRANEVIYLLSPLYNVTRQYSVGVKAKYVTSSTVKISANTDYVLQAGEYIELRYVDTNGQPKEDKITQGIILTTVDLLPNIERILTAQSTVSLKEPSVATIPMNTEYIVLLNSNKFEEAGKYYFKLDAGESITLDTDEYLFYTNQSRTEIIMLGSGVELKNTSVDKNIKQELLAINLSDINTSTINDIDWFKLNTPLETVEYEVISLGEGTSVRLLDNISGSITIDNDYKYLTTTGLEDGTPLQLEYISSNGSSVVSTNPAGEPYKVRTRFNIVYTQEPISVFEGQEVILNYEGGSYTVTGTVDGVNIQFNTPFISAGSSTIEIPTNVDLKAYIYTEDDDYAYKRVGEFITLKKTEEPVVELEFDFSNLQGVTGSTFDVNGKGTLYLIPITINSNSTAPVQSIKTYNGSNWIDVLPMTKFSNGVSSFDYKSSTYILYVEPGNKDLQITFDDTVDGPEVTMRVGRIKIVSGVNLEEINTSFADITDPNHPDYFSLRLTPVVSSTPKDSIFGLISKINDRVTDLTFNYTYIVPETNKVLFPTISENFFNINHIANSYTIPYFDPTKFNIKVNQFSIK